jgi:aspartate aminotransferase
MRRHLDCLTPAAKALAASPALAMAERADALGAQGIDVARLALGQSPFPVPTVMVEALRAAAAERHYQPVKGLHALRKAVAEYTERRLQIDRTAEDVLIGPGSKELVFLLQTVWDGDLVVPSPAWVPYAPQADILGRTVIPIHAQAANQWLATPEEIDRALSTPPTTRPRLLVLNSPNNPTGLAYRAEDLRAIAGIAARHRALVLSDEIYGELHHKSPHPSIARWYPEGTIVSGGLSKWTGAGGWRLGTFVFPEELRPVLDAMARVASETFTSTSAPVQHAALVAFQGSESIDRYLANVRRVLSLLGRHVARKLSATGLHCPQPSAGFYVFADFEKFRAPLAGMGITTSDALVERLLEDAAVAVLPGSSFGRDPLELTVRLAYVDFDGARALEAVSVIPKEQPLEETFLRGYTPRVLAAVERIARWLSALAV